jgi:hypothetical protein
MDVIMGQTVGCYRLGQNIITIVMVFDTMNKLVVKYCAMAPTKIVFPGWIIDHSEHQAPPGFIGVESGEVPEARVESGTKGCIQPLAKIVQIECIKVAYLWSLNLNDTEDLALFDFESASSSGWHHELID